MSVGYLMLRCVLLSLFVAMIFGGEKEAFTARLDSAASLSCADYRAFRAEVLHADPLVMGAWLTEAITTDNLGKRWMARSWLGIMRDPLRARFSEHVIEALDAKPFAPASELEIDAMNKEKVDRFLKEQWRDDFGRMLSKGPRLSDILALLLDAAKAKSDVAQPGVIFHILHFYSKEMIIDATEESELRTLHRDCFFPIDETDRKISIGMRDNAMGFMDTPSLILALALMGKSEASDLALAGLARRRDFSGSLAVVWRSCRTYTYQGYPAPSRLFSGAWLDQWLQNADVAQVRLLLSALITPDNEFKRFPLTESPAIPSVILRWRKDAFDDDLHKRYNAVVQGAVDSAIVGLNDPEFSDESGNFNPFAEIDTYPAWPVSAVPRLLAIKTTNELARSMRDKIVIYLQQRKESGPTGVELEIMLRDLEKQWE